MRCKSCNRTVKQTNFDKIWWVKYQVCNFCYKRGRINCEKCFNSFANNNLDNFRLGWNRKGKMLCGNCSDRMNTK